MTADDKGRLCLIGAHGFKIYGLPLDEWQRRNWARAGVSGAAGVVCAASSWVLSSGLAAAIVAKPGAALVAPTARGRRLVAAHLADPSHLEAVEALIAEQTANDEDIRALGLEPEAADVLAPPYNQTLRKRETAFAIDLEAEGARKAEKALFDSSYKGVTDFVTKYAWPVPAFAVTRWCAARRISPNTVTTVSLVFVLLAMLFFWRGDWALGFVSAWIMTFLDTVDGKLARTTLTSSKWGDWYDHGIDLLHPPFWYWAWVEGVRATETVDPDYLDAALIVILAGYVFGRVVEGVFIAAHGFHIHVWGKSDSFMRVITARRNPNTFIFMIGCMIGAPVEGFYAVAIWTVLTNGFHFVRMLQAGVRPANPPLTSWMAA